ncbi:hypothetical protein QQF64_036008 [Cirrhinus molitorella]|uniref:FISNA domain-containing protein n=1 Tax=Cirrhinus molitorella TaxID=172907 RepID=A0ABR3NIE2_9TELE
MSMEPPIRFKSGDKQTVLSPIHQKRSEPEPSCVSMKSDMSMEPPIRFKSGDKQTVLSPVHQKRSEPEFSCVSIKSDTSVIQPLDFKSGDAQPALSHEVLNTFRSNLMKKFECLYEGTALQGNPTLLNEIYTELYITESESGEINNEHELQLVQNSAARIITETPSLHHITPVLQQLHWLPVKLRIDFKILLYVFKAIHNLAPPYLFDLLHIAIPSHSLRSSSSIHLTVPSACLSTMGSRVFSCSAPLLWNALPPDIRNIDSLPLFKSRLKTHLFILA